MNPYKDQHLHTFLVEHGEPVFFLRANEKLCLKVAQHHLALLSVDPSVPAIEVQRVAENVNAIQDWQIKKGVAK